MFNRVIHTSVACSVLAVIAINIRADETAIGFDTNASWNLSQGPAVFGWQFSPRSDLLLTALGLYDAKNSGGGTFVGDGFLEQHPIGVWDVSVPSVPLEGSLIPVGTSALFINGFRYVSINPLRLSAGREYFIGALYTNQQFSAGDWFVNEFGNPSFRPIVNSELEFHGRRSGGVYSSSLVFPDLFEPGIIGDFGPNFAFTVVPEPSAAVIFLVGLSVLLGFTKRRHSAVVEDIAPICARATLK